MILLRFSYLIIIANFLFFLIGFTNNIGFVGALAGGLTAIASDTVIIFMAIIIGAGLVVQQSRFSILYFILAAVFGAAVVHYFLDTTKLIVDIIRVDVLLIIPSIIIIIASLFGPKSKPTKVKLIKIDPSTQKGIRILILIFSAAVLTYTLFYCSNCNSGNAFKYGNIDRTSFGKYVSKPLIYPMLREVFVEICGKELEAIEDQLEGKPVIKLNKGCNVYSDHDLVKTDAFTRFELQNRIRGRSLWVAKWTGAKHSTRIFILEIVHTLLFLILMTVVWKLRFRITHALMTPIGTDEPKQIGNNLTKAIKKFFKSI